MFKMEVFSLLRDYQMFELKGKTYIYIHIHIYIYIYIIYIYNIRYIWEK